MAESNEIGDSELLYQEILPRLPVKSILRFKVVCKKWLNFLTHDPLFPTHHYTKSPNTTLYFFSFKSRIFYSTDGHSSWSKPSSMASHRALVRGSTNGLIYGQCLNLTQLFICNPITKHTVYVPNPNKLCVMGLAWDPYHPCFGYTIVCPVFIGEEIDGVEALEFHVYSSRTGKWRVSEKALGFKIPSGRFMQRMFSAASTVNGRVYFSLIDCVMWFDVEKDVAGLIRCPDQGNFVPYDNNRFRTEIGACQGKVSYTRMTKEGGVEIWLLRHNDSEVEWEKKYTVGLLGIVEENLDAMFEMICCGDVNIEVQDNVVICGEEANSEVRELVRGNAVICYQDLNAEELENLLIFVDHMNGVLAENEANYEEDVTKEVQKNAAEVLARVVPLPYSGLEELWFLMETLNNTKKAFSFNLRTQELKLINKDGTILEPFFPVLPTLLPCPT